MSTTRQVAGPSELPAEQHQDAASGQVAEADRILYIDNIRVVLIALVVAGHLAITYSGDARIGDWYTYESGELSEATSILLAVLLGIGWAFAMGLFFLIAGYFTPRPYERKGAGKFLTDRLIRFGAPLLFYALIINPLATYWAARGRGYVGSFWQFVTNNPDELTSAAVGPLWFVELLLIFTIVYAGWRLVRGRTAAAQVTESRPPGNRSILMFALGLGLATFVARIFFHVGWWWEPPHLEPAHLLAYAAMFAAGTVAYGRGWLDNFSDAQARPWRWLSLLLVLFMPVLALAAGAGEGELDPAGSGGLTWLSLAYSLWEGLMCVAMSLTVLALFRRRFNHQGALARQMATDSYAVYVLHPLVIVPLAVLLYDLRLPLEPKFLVAAPIGVALSFLFGHLVRRLPLVRHVL